MLTRTRREKVTFERSFMLESVGRKLSPGDYEVITDEELIEQLSFPAYRRVSTSIMVPARSQGSSAIEMISIGPDELATALELDRAAIAKDMPRDHRSEPHDG